MIQFNLLPDIKLKLIKAKRAERLAITISTIAIIASVVLMIIAFSVVDGLQKKSLSDVNNDVAKYTAEIKSTPSLNKILTIQNQLNALPALEDQKPIVTRLFGYISQVTPQLANLTDLQLDFTENTIDFTGTADSLSTVDKFVDTLKFTTYSTGVKGFTPQPAFSDVVLSSFGDSSQGASFDITADFDPVIFNEADSIKLAIPNIISTRSEVDQPLDLFTGTGSDNSSTKSSDNTQQ